MVKHKLAHLATMLLVLMMVSGFSSEVFSAPLPEEKLVGNTGSTDDGWWTGYTSHTYYSQEFTTGSHTDGYKVTKVKLGFKDLSSTEASVVDVSLHEANQDSRPGTKLFTFDEPSSFETSGDFTELTFTTPSSGKTKVLSPDTDYVIRIAHDSHLNGSFRVQDTWSDGEDSDSAAGWSISNVSKWSFRIVGNHSNSTGQRDQVIWMKLRGHEHVPDGGLRFATRPSSVSSSESVSGRLEIFDDSDEDGDGEWKWICNDGFGEEEAKVACNQLGESTDETTVWALPDNWLQVQSTGLRALAELFYIAGLMAIPALLDDVVCDGDEAELLDCEHSGRGESDCGISQSVGVTCKETSDEE